MRWMEEVADVDNGLGDKITFQPHFPEQYAKIRSIERSMPSVPSEEERHHAAQKHRRLREEGFKRLKTHPNEATVSNPNGIVYKD